MTKDFFPIMMFVLLCAFLFLYVPAMAFGLDNYVLVIMGFTTGVAASVIIHQLLKEAQ